MTYTSDQIIASNQASVQVLEDLTVQAFFGLEKLVELNLAASRAILGESFGHIKAVFGTKDLHEMLAVQAGLFQSLAEKSADFGQHVRVAAAATGAEFTKVFDTKLVDAQIALADLVDDFTKNAPTRAQTAAQAFKNAVNANQTAVVSARRSARKALEAAESTISSATKRAVNATTIVTKIR